MKEGLTQGLVIAVVAGVVLAIIGGMFSTYTDVQELKGKMEWIYKYTFPEAK